MTPDSQLSRASEPDQPWRMQSVGVCNLSRILVEVPKQITQSMIVISTVCDDLTAKGRPLSHNMYLAGT